MRRIAIVTAVAALAVAGLGTAAAATNRTPRTVGSGHSMAATLADVVAVRAMNQPGLFRAYNNLGGGCHIVMDGA